MSSSNSPVAAFTAMAVSTIVGPGWRAATGAATTPTKRAAAAIAAVNRTRTMVAPSVDGMG